MCDHHWMSYDKELVYIVCDITLAVNEEFIVMHACLLHHTSAHYLNQIMDGKQQYY